MKLRDYLAGLERDFAPNDVRIGEGANARLPGELLRSLPAKELDALIALEGNDGGIRYFETERKEGFLFAKKVRTKYIVAWRMSREGWAKSERGDKLHFFSAKAGDGQFKSACGRDYLPPDRRLSAAPSSETQACKVCLRAVES